ncbi:MAG: endonuclease Q family protein [Candidatus Thorarchaeota archaeon]|jgi:PHP family Zn ribbon phosphoesterase
MNIPTLAQGAKEKGLQIIGTGDATQPDWLQHLRKYLILKDDILFHDSIAFIPTVEIEDNESIHHVILLPDYESVETLRTTLKPHSLNIDDEWGGRPRARVNGEMLAGFVRDAGGMIGPAHAFTPFRSIFRENKHTSLKSCYGDETPHIHFLELGLSADSNTADFIPDLRRLTFITSSDAHSPTPNKLGREFVRFEMKEPTFDELKLAIKRKNGRKPLLNVGLDPRLGKYFLSFCSKCRRTLVLQTGNDPPSFDKLNIYISCGNTGERKRLLEDIHRRMVKCPADGKKLRLGVRDRATAIGNGEVKTPSHRPPYLHIAPLLDIIALSLEVKSSTSKRVKSLYDKMRDQFGPETLILTEAPIEGIKENNERVAQMIEAYRNKSIGYLAGGGGRYGALIPPWENDNS